MVTYSIDLFIQFLHILFVIHMNKRISPMGCVTIDRYIASIKCFEYFFTISTLGGTLHLRVCNAPTNLLT